MSKLGKGPEIKIPKISAPPFATDLWSDLRDRRLLPLIAVLAVAIVAVPIALKSSSPTLSSTTGQSGLPIAGVSTDAGSGTVVAYAPGLRDYRRRLKHLQATDPFKQHFSPNTLKTTGTSAASDSGAAATTTSPGSDATVYGTPASPTTSATNGTGPGTNAGGPATVRVETKYASYEIDVRIVSAGKGSGSGGNSGRQDRAGGRTKTKTYFRRHLPELTMLPSRKTPAAVFMGVSSDGKKALLLVSSDVRSVFGDARCVVGSEVCQLLALEPGLPETFVYGAREHHYRIELLKITKVLGSQPPKTAPFGKP
jgi:hypothetical protein